MFVGPKPFTVGVSDGEKPQTEASASLELTILLPQLTKHVSTVMCHLAVYYSQFKKKRSGDFKNKKNSKNEIMAASVI